MSYEDFNETREYPGGAGFNVPVPLAGQSALRQPGAGGSATPSGFVGYTGGPSGAGIASVTEPQKYGSASCYPVAILAAIDTVILFQPDTTRVFLTLQNVSLNDVWVQFGVAAAVNNGLLLASGGVFLFDAFVPSDDIHVFAAIASTIILAYANKGF